MNVGDRVHTPRGPATIIRFHYEPVSLGTRNIRRIAFVLIEYQDGTRQFVPPKTIIDQEAAMTTIQPEPEPTTGPAPGDPDPTPPQPEPPDDDDAQLVPWP